METVVITGANRGIGLGLAQEFLARQTRVIATCREPAQAAALQALAANPSLKILTLDVADPVSLEGFLHHLGEEKVDVLINNAGILGGEHQGIGDMDYPSWERTFAVNTIAPFRLTLGLLPNLKKSPRPRVVSLSSQMGSLTGSGVGYYAYRSSKAALNKVMAGMAKELEAHGIVVCPIHPGWVQTDMGGVNASISVSQCAAGIYTLVHSLTAAQSGHFLDWEGNALAW